MAKKDLVESVKLPEGVSVIEDKNNFTFKGNKGANIKRFDNPSIKVELKDREIVFSCKSASKKDKAVLHAYRAHTKNLIAGLSEHYVYVLKICSGHFPMNVSVSNNIMLIKNFLGEKVPRQLKLKQGVTVKVDGNIITIESSNKELAGQVAADIEKTTRRPGFDRRIFQDGIYIIEKAGKKI